MDEMEMMNLEMVSIGALRKVMPKAAEDIGIIASSLPSNYKQLATSILENTYAIHSLSGEKAVNDYIREVMLAPVHMLKELSGKDYIREHYMN